jgi:hypothetical protein
MLENMVIKPITVIQPFSPDGSVAWQAHELLQYVTYLWWECPSSHPSFPDCGSLQEKKGREQILDRLTDGLIHQLKHLPVSLGELHSVRQQIMTAASHFASNQLRFTSAEMDLIHKHRFFEVAAEFTRQARQFDTTLSDNDIYQASRNVMTMNFIQTLFGLPVSLTPSVFAYSMLYPYTDNYLDDPAISSETKQSFNLRFRRRLLGEDIHPVNQYEKTICNLVAMIESQFDRASFPQVYESLLVIHAAQVRSLRLLHRSTPPYEVDVLGITFAKGGTSVLADGYLVAGVLTQPQAEFLFGYGAFTQLMDDLEDIHNDQRDGQMTIFSQNAGCWPLDALANRTIHFGRKVFEGMDCFPSSDTQTLHDFLTRCIDPILIDIIGQARQYFQASYMAQLEDHLPFRCNYLHKLRQKLTRQKIALMDIVRLFA